MRTAPKIGALGFAFTLLVNCTGATNITPSHTAPVPNGSAVAKMVVLAVPSTAGVETGPWSLAIADVDGNGNPVSGAPVALTSTSGHLSVMSGSTDVNGALTATILPPGNSSASAVVAVKVVSGSQTAVIDILFAVPQTSFQTKGRFSPVGTQSSGSDPFVLGISTGNSNGSEFFSSPSACFIPYSSTPSSACQQTLQQDSLELGLPSTARTTCAALKAISGTVGAANCVAAAVTIAACVGFETGAGLVICAGGAEALAADSIGCATLIAGAIAAALHSALAGTIISSVSLVSEPTSASGYGDVICDSLELLYSIEPITISPNPTTLSASNPILTESLSSPVLSLPFVVSSVTCSRPGDGVAGLPITLPGGSDQNGLWVDTITVQVAGTLNVGDTCVATIVQGSPVVAQGQLTVGVVP